MRLPHEAQILSLRLVKINLSFAAKGRKSNFIRVMADSFLGGRPVVSPFRVSIPPMLLRERPARSLCSLRVGFPYFLFSHDFPCHPCLLIGQKFFPPGALAFLPLP
jgi:hypothetical protein